MKIYESNKRPTIVVTGANGQLGQELKVKAANMPEFEFLFTDRTSLDITDAKAVMDYFIAHRPDYCINAAAYTAVDKAENDQEAAQKANVDAIANLAEASFAHHTLLIHISTDYVFDGTATVPYTETAPTNPIGVYAATKLAGELELKRISEKNYIENYIIVRTSWVYSSFGNNFVKTMLRLMQDRPEIRVVNDQTGSPTYAADLAGALLELVKLAYSKTIKFRAKIYHYSNEGQCTWYEFACKIAELSGYTGKVLPITTAEYPTPAKRPAYSVFDKTKIKTETGIQIPAWEQALANCLQIVLKK